MSKDVSPNSLYWAGEGWSVRVLYSRAGVATSILVSPGSDKHLLLDCGDGTLRDLVNLGVDLGSVHAILFSHGHFDHVGGLYSLLGYMRMIGRSQDLYIISPLGSSQDRILLEGFHALYEETTPFAVNRNEVGEGEEFELLGISIRPFDVVHCGSTKHGGIGEPLPALGYTLLYNDQRVVFTGDCGLDSNLEARIRGADLVIIEATLKESGGEMERRVHLSLDSASRLVRLAKRAFIIHRVEDMPPLEVGRWQ